MKIKLLDVRVRIGFGIILFGIALLDSILFGAASFAMLSWWGKTATILFMINFIVLFFELFLLPLYFKFKKLFNKK